MSTSERVMFAPGTCRRVLLLTAMLCMLGPQTVCAQPSAEPEPVEFAHSDAPGDGEEMREKRKRASATAGILALFGVALAGIAMLAFVIIWGRRLRRISHQPYPEVRRTDDLWFLKPEKKSQSADKEPATGDDADDRTDVP